MASPGHSRNYSENAISESPRMDPYPSRSASAGPRYGRIAMAGTPPETGSSETSPRGMHLESLSEDNVPQFQVDNVRSSIDSDGYWSATSERRSLSRSASTAQMRDLKDQMYDLKGRLSVLRDRARDDTMKRRSMQSLRTPSPFTAAEQWYTQGQTVKSPGLSVDAGVGLASPLDTERGHDFTDDASAVDGVGQKPGHKYSSSDATSIYEDVNTSPKAKDAEVSGEDNYDTAEDSHVEDFEVEGSEYSEEMVNHEELEDYESDSTQYHDSLEAPISHEDREDAFDYEHFFLHSAMGTIGNDRRGSFSSEDSVETTRGPPLPEKALKERPSLNHLRSESTDSLSTVDSFQTATEGNGSENEDDEERDSFAVQSVTAPGRRSPTLTTIKRSTFGSPARKEIQSGSEDLERPNSAIYDPQGRDSSNIHRPSISSIGSSGSTGTQRSFPLINKPKPEVSLNGVADSRASQQSESSTLVGSQNGVGRFQPSPVDMLGRDDQILVERLVASLGKCVLGLQESSPGSYDGRVWRRRLDFARRTLDGEENII